MEHAVSPVDKVIAAFGGLTKAATALGIDNPSVIANWRTRGQVPADKVLAVEAASNISRHDLRPDIFGPAPTRSERASA